MATVAGTVDSLSGSVSISRNGATALPLAVVAAVNQGDLVATGAEAWVLFEMADGGSLTMRGKTRLRIDAYAYSENDRTGNKSWFSLLEGAMRSVTGAIGTFNPPGYRLSTSIVTLGIRGTDHETAYFPAGSTEPGVEPGVYDKVNQGETTLRTPRGEVRLKAGQAGFTDHLGAHAPRMLAAIPSFYRRHAEIDRPLANRMRLIQTRREKRIQMLKQRFGHGKETVGGNGARLHEHQGEKRPGERAENRRQHARAPHENLQQPGNSGQAGQKHERKRHQQNEPR